MTLSLFCSFVIMNSKWAFNPMAPQCKHSIINAKWRVWGWHSHSRNEDLWILWNSLTLEFDCRGQNTLHWGVLYIIEKLLKCRCRKWACINHLDICSTSYGKKKGPESNWQFDSRPLKVRNRPNPDVCRWIVRHTTRKFSRRDISLLQTSSQSKVWTKNYDLAKS
jgi:hypothetical protein